MSTHVTPWLNGDTEQRYVEPANFSAYANRADAIITLCQKVAGLRFQGDEDHAFHILAQMIERFPKRTEFINETVAWHLDEMSRREVKAPTGEFVDSCRQ